MNYTIQNTDRYKTNERSKEYTINRKYKAY